MVWSMIFCSITSWLAAILMMWTAGDWETYMEGMSNGLSSSRCRNNTLRNLSHPAIYELVHGCPWTVRRRCILRPRNDWAQRKYNLIPFRNVPADSLLSSSSSLERTWQVHDLLGAWPVIGHSLTLNTSPKSTRHLAFHFAQCLRLL